MNKEGQLRPEEVEAELRRNDLEILETVKKPNQKKADVLGKEIDKLLFDKAVIDETRDLNVELHNPKN